MNSPQFEPLLSDVQAGALLHLHPKTVQKMARAGSIPAYRIGKYWRYRATELNNWLVLHSVSNDSPAHQREEKKL